MTLEMEETQEMKGMLSSIMSVLVPGEGGPLHVERMDDSIHSMNASHYVQRSRSRSGYNRRLLSDERKVDLARPSRRHMKWLLKVVAKNVFFAQLTKKERKCIIGLMHREVIKHGQTLIREEEVNNMFYVVECGSFAIETEKDGAVDTAVLNDLMGEDALVHKGLGEYTARAESKALVWAICRSKIRQRMMTLNLNKSSKRSIFQRVLRNTAYASSPRNPSSLSPDDTTSSTTCSSPPANNVSRRMSVTQNMGQLEDFGLIGTGECGVVLLVRDPNTKEMFALRAMQKDLIVEHDQQEQIQSALKTLRRLNNPFVTMLRQTFKDRFNVYFMCEVGMGGDFLHYLRSIDHLTPRQIQFYAACVVEALAYLHSLNIVYRDMKPENMVLGVDGYLKLTDFGLTKSLDKGDTFTFCGTKDYMAPEVIVGRGYGLAVDWWGLGILIYEMTACRPPFQANKSKTYEMILNHPIMYNPANRRFTAQLKDLINNLCVKNPRKRLCSGKGGAQSVRDHQWFRQWAFDWVALQNKTMSPAHIPRLSHSADRRHWPNKVSNPHVMKQEPIYYPRWAQDF